MHDEPVLSCLKQRLSALGIPYSPSPNCPAGVSHPDQIHFHLLPQEYVDLECRFDQVSDLIVSQLSKFPYYRSVKIWVDKNLKHDIPLKVQISASTAKGVRKKVDENFSPQELLIEALIRLRREQESDPSRDKELAIEQVEGALLRLNKELLFRQLNDSVPE